MLMSGECHGTTQVRQAGDNKEAWDLTWITGCKSIIMEDRRKSRATRNSPTLQAALVRQGAAGSQRTRTAGVT